MVSYIVLSFAIADKNLSYDSQIQYLSLEIIENSHPNLNLVSQDRINIDMHEEKIHGNFNENNLENNVNKSETPEINKKEKYK